MRPGAERFARRWWAGELGLGGAVLSVASAPLSWTWERAARRRARRFARRGGRRVDGLTVVSVGNLAVGGTGKTPLTAWVAQRLSRRAARGTAPPTVLVGPHGEDEAGLHARWSPGVHVSVSGDRVEGAERARRAGTRTVVLDDGFQHLSLHRDLDIVLLSADDPFPAPVLPRGPYREPADALARAHAVVVTRRSATDEAARRLAGAARTYAPRALSAGARLAPSGLRELVDWTGSAGATLSGHPPIASPSEPGPEGSLAVCAIARPETFRAAVAGLVSGPVELRAFADHHPYTAADVVFVRERAAGRPIVVTAKDAVKLAAWAEELGPVYVLEESLLWEWGEQALAGLLDAPVEERVRG